MFTEDALKTLQATATQATAIEMIVLSPSSTDVGLPETMPLFFDKIDQKIIPVKDEIERYRLFPARKRGTAATTALTSFIDLTNRHKTAHSALFISDINDLNRIKLTAVVDYHEIDNGNPANKEHRVTYGFPLTETAKTWVKIQNKQLSQKELAIFLEDNVVDIIDPSDEEKTYWEGYLRRVCGNPGQLIDFSRNLRVNASKDVTAGFNAQTGEETAIFTSTIRQSEDQKAKIPNLFLIRIALFEGGEPVLLPMRLSMEVIDKSAVWCISGQAFTQRLANEVIALATKAAEETVLPLFEGSPEA